MRCRGQTKSAIEEAAAILRSGGLVAIPTETVYGLAADACDDAAVAKIFEAKGRPSFNPLISHVADAEMARGLVVFSPLAEKLAAAFWPGPLTLVLPRRTTSPLSHLTTAGLETAAVRAPAHPLAQAVIAAVGRPLAAPSANRSGMVSPTTAAHVAGGLGDRVDLVLDGGACVIGLESAIVYVEGDAATLLRPGGLARADIEAVIGAPLDRVQDQKNAENQSRPSAPGMLKSHYAPAAALRLDVEEARKSEVALLFGAPSPAHDAHPYAIQLSAAGDLREAAARLFAAMREADALCASETLSGIAVAPIPNTGLGEAINDRLTRAAAPRHGFAAGADSTHKSVDPQS